MSGLWAHTMMRVPSSLLVGLLALAAVGCGYSEISPPQAPAREMPMDVEPRTTPPDPGLTRVILDANGEKATVVEVVDTTQSVGRGTVDGSDVIVHGYAETSKPVCVAPCVADLKPGMHVLRFTSASGDGRSSEASVQIGDRSKVIRHAMGRTEGFSFGDFAGTMLVLLGATAALTGAGLYAGGSVGRESKDLKDAGIAVGAAGLGSVMIGIPLMIFLRPVHQPGATTEMALAK